MLFRGAYTQPSTEPSTGSGSSTAWACGFNGAGQLAAPPSLLCWTKFEEISGGRARVRAATWALLVVVEGGEREARESDESEALGGRELNGDDNGEESEELNDRRELHEHDGAESVRWFGHCAGTVSAASATSGGVRHIAATPAWLWILRKDGRLEAVPWSEPGESKIVAEGCKAFGVGEHVGAIVTGASVFPRARTRPRS